MPLLKLWNTLRGHFAANRSAPLAPAQLDPPCAAVRPAQVAPSTRRPAAKAGVRSLLGGPHGALRKLVKSIPAKTLVEISVGDGSRATALVPALAAAGEVRYLAIDPFELGGGELTLKQFHQQLRQAGIRAHLIPDSIVGGLNQVARTVGQVDLVIIAADRDCWQQPAPLARLARICHAQTVVLFQDDQGNWQRYLSPATPLRRAA